MQATCRGRRPRTTGSNTLPQRIREPATAVEEVLLNAEAGGRRKGLDLRQIVLMRTLHVDAFPCLEGETAAESVDRHFLVLQAQETSLANAPAAWRVPDALRTGRTDGIISFSSIMGQADSVKLGIARALMLFNAELRKGLKAEGLVSRDARIKERKKYGQKGARARFQFSKR